MITAGTSMYGLTHTSSVIIHDSPLNMQISTLKSPLINYPYHIPIIFPVRPRKVQWRVGVHHFTSLRWRRFRGLEKYLGGGCGNSIVLCSNVGEMIHVEYVDMTHLHEHTCMTCMHIYMHASTHSCIHGDQHTCIHHHDPCMHTYMQTYRHAYAITYLCSYAHTQQ